MKGYMYILLCSDGSYYTGSTNNLELRLAQHQSGQGANHTKKRLPVKLVYCEEYPRVDEAFYREKQVQGWNRKKKEALINGTPELLPGLAVAYRDLNGELVASRASATSSRASATIPLPEALEGNDNEAVTTPLPEALEGNDSEATTIPLPEALEGNTKEVLEGNEEGNENISKDE